MHGLKRRYTGLRSERLAELVERFEADPEPLDMLSELAAARALFVDFIERHGEWRNALLAWHHSFSDEYADEVREVHQRWVSQGSPGGVFLPPEPMPNKPRQMLDVVDAYRVLSEVTKIVERIEKLRMADAVARGDLMRMLDQMWGAVLLFVEDDRTRNLIRARWLELCVGSSRGGG